ncbi:MAG: hypothetical protein HQ582_16950 [Planctomycetes bacterium]|nr:hypothetical protein [Planctomycetota bacterium]
MPTWLIRASMLLAITVACVLLAITVAAPGRFAADSVVFPLREISILDSSLDPSLLRDLTRGARAGSQEEPHEAIKAYPKLLSKKPIYGLIRLAPDPYQRESGTPLYFVVDESGEDPAREEPAEEEPEEESSILDKLSSALFGKKAEKPVEKLPRLNNTYDRLYVDLNGDLDLTNDLVVTPMKKTPTTLVRRYSSLRQVVVFKEISVRLDFGEELGNQPVRLVPRLEIQEHEGEEYPGVAFISAVARQGSIKLGNRSYQAVVAQRYLITGRYDRTSTGLSLTSPNNSSWREAWWGADQLNAMRLVDGKYYTTSTTPLGDRLIVKPHRGDLGILRIGRGERDLDNLSIQGSLRTKDAPLAVGEPKSSRSGLLEPVTECRLPVGDYIPVYVTVRFGDLQLGISENYHCDGKRMALDRESWVHGIKIRKDKPFVWDFSTPPEVMFASPAKDQTYKSGDEIEVNAVLIDPKLTIMIRRLTDTSRKEAKTVELGDGRTTTHKQSVSLDPTVTITNAAGKQIAEGPMPFG